jgi:acetyl esterase
LDNYDRVLRRLANDAQVCVLSVDYRLAPEFPFPAGLDDAYAATCWASEHRAELGAARSFLAVGGDSSGANLAAAVAQRARDGAGPAIDHQLLLYPVVSRAFQTPAYERFGTGYFLTRRAMEFFWSCYVGDRGRPLYADLLATPTLAGLPAATIITCALDPLSSEGEKYADALAEAGTPTTLLRVYGLVHGAWLMDARSERAHQLGVDLAENLRRAHHTTATHSNDEETDHAH